MVQFPVNLGGLSSIGIMALLQSIVKTCLDLDLRWHHPNSKGKKVAAAYAWLKTGMMAKFPLSGLGSDLALYEETAEHTGRCVKITYTDTLHVTCPDECGKVVEDRLLKLGEGYALLIQGIPGQFEEGLEETSRRLRIDPYYTDENGVVVREKGKKKVHGEKQLSTVRQLLNEISEN